MMIRSAFAILLLMLAGCASVTDQQLQQAKQRIFADKITPGDIQLFMISPGGYYLPWAKYEIELVHTLIDGSNLESLTTNSFKKRKVKQHQTITVRYRYNEGFSRSIVKWKETQLAVTDKNVFLLFKDIRVKQLSEKDGIEEIALIMFNDKYNH